MSSRSSLTTESQARVQSAAFSKCLVDPDPATAARIRHRRQRAMGISAVAEISIVAAILIWPLFATGTRLVRRVFIPISPYGAHRAQNQSENRRHTPTSGLVVPHEPPIPGPRILTAPVAPNNRAIPDSGIPTLDIGNNPSNSNSDALIPIFSAESAPAPPRPESAPARRPAAPVRRSEGVQAALLIHRVEPRYPPLCFQTRREGTVQLHAVIARDGSIASLEVLSGDPRFIRDALEAVRQWHYRPTMLGSEPVEVDTFITVNFRLSR